MGPGMGRAFEGWGLETYLNKFLLRFGGALSMKGLKLDFAGVELSGSGATWGWRWPHPPKSIGLAQGQDLR